MNNSSDVAAVRANLNNWLQAFNRKDIDALFALYDPNSVYANAGAPLLTGIDQIKPWYEAAFSAVEGTLLFQEEFLCQETDMALLVGKYYFSPPATGSTQPASSGDAGRVALVYRRVSDGDWRLLFDMDNTPPDVSAADF